jgi:hypothetical protein
MATERPLWQRALSGVFEALSPEEQEAAREHRRERRELGKARKAERLALARRVFEMHDDGKTAAEIGAAVGGKSASWVYRFSGARGVVISPFAKSVRRAIGSAWLTRQRSNGSRVTVG